MVCGGIAGGAGALAMLANFSLGPMPDEVSKLIWYAIRVAGVGAYLTLWLTTVAGLAISARVGGKLGAILYPIHQLGDLALSLTVLHATLLLGDRFAGFTPATIVVPFASTYRPVATGLGILALYIAAAVYWSAELRPRIGYRAWHVIHQSSLVAFAFALVHGLAGGTDSGAPAMKLLYAATGSVVAFLILVRLRQSQSSGTRVQQPGAASRSA